MDLISLAIVKTVSGNAAGHPDETPAKTYQALRLALIETFGTGNDLIHALVMLERKPNSPARQALLIEEVLANNAHEQPHLQEAAQRLLDALQPASAMSKIPTGPIPLQRLRAVDHFTGRKAELTQLITGLQPGQVVNVYGPTGIGKHALIATALWHLAPHNTAPETFSDGILCHSFYTQPRVDIALEEMVRTFELELAPSAYEAAQKLFARKKLLLVLDGVEHADNLPDMLAMRGLCTILVTSNQPLPEATTSIQLLPLTSQAEQTLLQAWGGRQEPAASQRLGELVGHLPLAIKLMGCYLNGQKQNIDSLVTWLESTPLAHLELAARQEAVLPLLLEHILAQLSESAGETLAIAGLLALQPFEPDVIANAQTVPTDTGLLTTIRDLFKSRPKEQLPQTRLALRDLSSYGLLRWLGSQYQISHPWVYSYIQQHLAAPPQAVRRLAQYYMAVAWAQQGAADSATAIQFNNIRPHIMMVMAQCVKQAEWEAAHGLAAAIEDYLDRNGFWADRVTANEVGLIAAWQLGRPSEGAWIGNLGDTYRTMGHAKWAIEHFEQALATARQSGDRHGEGNSLGNLGLTYRDLGQIDQAIFYLGEAKTIFEAIRSPSAGLVRDWLNELKKLEETT